MTDPPTIGDVLFFKTMRTPIDRLIVKRTGSEYVHVAIVLSNNREIQAVSGGVQIRPLATNWNAIARVGAALRQTDRIRFAQAIIDIVGMSGRRYGFGDVVDQLLIWLPGKPAISFDRSADCSHLVVMFLSAAGYDLPFNTEGDRVTPGDLARTLKPEEVQ